MTCGERGSLHFICQNGNMQFARHSQKISNFVIHNAEELPRGELVLHWDRKVEEAGRTSLLENEVRERKRFTDPAPTDEQHGIVDILESTKETGNPCLESLSKTSPGSVG